MAYTPYQIKDNATNTFYVQTSVYGGNGSGPTQGIVNVFDLVAVGGTAIAMGQQTTAASFPVVLPASQITSLQATNADGSLTGGAAGSKSLAFGGVYNTSLPTLTNGQQSAIQVDSSGRQIVVVGPGTSSIGTVALDTTNSTYLSTISTAQGAGGTGITQPTGGSGLLGWLSGIYKAITGTLTVTMAPSTTNGLTPYRSLPTGATNQDSTVVKSSAGTLFGIQASSIASSAVWLKLYDTATAPTSSSTPIKTILIPANTTSANGAGNNLNLSTMGIKFSNGIAFRVSTGIADSDATAVTTGQLAINFDYA
jgi:hypothetical protein